MSQEDVLAEALAQLAEVRAALAEQREINARHEAALSALREEARQRQLHTPERIAETDAAEQPAQVKSKRGTSRRGLLRGAAAGAAAAAVAAVAVGGAEQAHAAPAADGSDLVLGQGNTASSTTTLTLTSGASSTPTLLSLDATGVPANVPATVLAAQAGGVSIGIYSQSVNNDAIRSIASYGTAVHAVSTYGAGVDAFSGYGVGVLATSRTYLDIGAVGTGRIWQIVQALPGAPASGTYNAGESIRDANGDLWLCTAGNNTTLGTWVKVAHLAPGATVGGAITYLAEPIRLLDTRLGATDANQLPDAPCQPGGIVTVKVASVSFPNPITSTVVNVPATAVGAIGNVTVVGATSAGYVSLIPSGDGFLGTSNVNYVAGQTVPNSFNVPLNGGKFDIYVDPNSNAVDVIIDLFAVVA